jgi:hypothetical protein
MKTARFPQRVRAWKLQLGIDWIFDRRIILHDPEFARIRRTVNAHSADKTH